MFLEAKDICARNPNGIPVDFLLGALHVALFGIAEAPDFIALDALAGQAAYILVMVGSADLASVHQDFRNRVDRHIANPRSRSEAGPLAEHGEDLDTLL